MAKIKNSQLANLKNFPKKLKCTKVPTPTSSGATALINLSETKSEYDKIASALKDVRETGYGIVSPTTEEMSLDEPKIVKQGGRFGVKLKASAPSIHMMCNKPKSLEAA